MLGIWKSGRVLSILGMPLNTIYLPELVQYDLIISASRPELDDDNLLWWLGWSSYPLTLLPDLISWFLFGCVIPLTALLGISSQEENRQRCKQDICNESFEEGMLARHTSGSILCVWFCLLYRQP